MTRRRRRDKGDPMLERIAVEFWLAVQIMTRRRRKPPPGLLDPVDDDGPDDDRPDDEGAAGSGVPLRPAPSSGSASAAVTTDEDRTGEER